MIVFRNPGLIDLAAVTTLGVSVKKPGAFGRFGTGLKFALATILRGGGEVSIYRGTDHHRVATKTAKIACQPFELVTLDGQPMGITTQLGRDWEPWMVLRELGCNALDEAGSFELVEDGRTIVPQAGETTIMVSWPDLETAYAQRDQLFLTGEPLFANDKLRILPGPSAHIFYRGVRVFKTAKPSQFTYDILAEQALTEDRTLAGSYTADGIIRDAILTMDNTEIVRQAISTGTDYHEGGLNFGETYTWGVTPSTDFLKAATIVRESPDKEKLSASARTVLAKASRKQLAEEKTRTRVENTSFTDAVGHLYELGMEFADEQQFVEVNELPGDARSVLENGTIFMLRALMHANSREVAGELIRRWVDLQPSVYTLDAAVALLAPKLLDAVPECRRQREQAEERARREAERAEAAAAAQAEREAAAALEAAEPVTPPEAPALDDGPQF